MILKKKEFFLLIFLIFIQSCSGGSIGNFLESSFDNLENKNKADEKINLLDNKKVINSKNKEDSKKNNEAMKKDEEVAKNSLENKNFVKLQKRNKTRKTNIVKKIPKKNDLQSYKIIFILKDVDPMAPIDELSTILRNSGVNFEIEKIERYFDPKTKTIKSN